MSYFCLGHQKSQIEIKATKLTVFKISNRNCLNKINVYGTCSQRDPGGLKLRERDLGIVKHLRIVITVFIEQLLFNRHCTENLYALCTHYTHNPKRECSEKKMTQEKVIIGRARLTIRQKRKLMTKTRKGSFLKSYSNLIGKECMKGVGWSK